jgi:hypothetical protein
VALKSAKSANTGKKNFCKNIQYGFLKNPEFHADFKFVEKVFLTFRHAHVNNFIRMEFFATF